jgi:hypothetical protein
MHAAVVGREGAGTGSKQGKGHQQSLQSFKHEAELVARAAETSSKARSSSEGSTRGISGQAKSTDGD